MPASPASVFRESGFLYHLSPACFSSFEGLVGFGGLDGDGSSFPVGIFFVGS